MWGVTTMRNELKASHDHVPHMSCCCKIRWRDGPWIETQRCVVTAGMLMETQAAMNSMLINQNAAIWEHTTVVFGERWSHSHLFRIELYRNSTMRSFLYPWSSPANLSAMVSVLTQWLLEVKVLAFLVEDYLCSMFWPLVAFIVNGPDRCRATSAGREEDNIG